VKILCNKLTRKSTLTEMADLEQRVEGLSRGEGTRYVGVSENLNLKVIYTAKIECGHVLRVLLEVRDCHRK
jgi:hypothetical protein